jgi:hypothetical protein
VSYGEIDLPQSVPVSEIDDCVDVNVAKELLASLEEELKACWVERYSNSI